MQNQTYLHVKIIFGGHNALVGWENDRLKIRLSAVPEKGKANQELIVYLAKLLAISKSSIEIVQGQTARFKKLLIHGLNENELTNSINLKIKKQ